MDKMKKVPKLERKCTTSEHNLKFLLKKKSFKDPENVIV